jgi:hypothetical protein
VGLPAIFATISGVRGINSEQRPLAITGLVLTGLGVVLGIVLIAAFRR